MWYQLGQAFFSVLVLLIVLFLLRVQIAWLVGRMQLLLRASRQEIKRAYKEGKQKGKEDHE